MPTWRSLGSKTDVRHAEDWNGDMDQTAPPSRVIGDRPELESETLTVIVPCLNEEETVEATTESILEVAPDLPVDVRMFYIDDGSTDATLDVMKGIVRDRSDCRIMVNPENLGLGRSILRAYEKIPPSSWATVLPGDNELIFRSIENFLEIREDYDIILGYLKNPVIRPLPRRLGSEAFTVVANTLYGFNFEYFNGMKLYRIGAFQGIDVEANGHAFNPELLAKAVLRDPDLRIGEAPFMTKGRKHGSSRAFSVSSMVEAVEDVVRGYKSVADYRERVIQGAQGTR